MDTYVPSSGKLTVSWDYSKDTDTTCAVVISQDNCDNMNVMNVIHGTTAYDLINTLINNKEDMT